MARLAGTRPFARHRPICSPRLAPSSRGASGTGFKAPTLDELYDSFPAFGFFANPNLKPEESVGWDAGFEQKLTGLLPAAPPVEFGSTFFHNDISNLIDTNSTGTSYVNIGKATTYGTENYVSYKPWETLTLRADYTYTMANDDITHTELLRRPKHKVSVDAKWQATDALSFTATAVYKANGRTSTATEPRPVSSRRPTR